MPIKVRKPCIADIIEHVSLAPTREEKVAMLRHYYTQGLALVLRYALDPSVKWYLPKGSPPYNPLSGSGAETILYRQALKLYQFISGPNVKPSPILPDERDDPRRAAMKARKREMNFQGLLENVDPRDAVLLLSIKEKRLPHPIEVDVILEAFPGLFAEVPEKIDGEVAA